MPLGYVLVSVAMRRSSSNAWSVENVSTAMSLPRTNSYAVPFADCFKEAHSSAEIAHIMSVRRAVLAGHVSAMDGLALLEAYSNLTDAAVRRAVDLATGGGDGASNPVHCLSERNSVLSHLAIVAVGGYGRSEMAPFSDVDIAFIADSEDDPGVELVAKRAFCLLMEIVDGAGLKLGYSFRTPMDVDNLPLETITALTDARLIVGSSDVLNLFQHALKVAMSPCAFVMNHIRRRLNGDSASASPYVTNPDVKHSPGGLRDLQMAAWIARVAFDIDDPLIWPALCVRKVITGSDLARVSEAAEFIATVRIHLHIVSGRSADVLTPEKAAAVACRMGLVDGQELMSKYYANAGVVFRIARCVAQACQEKPLRIEASVYARGGFIRVFDPAVFVADSATWVRMFNCCREYGLGIHRNSYTLITRAARRSSPDIRARLEFLEMLACPCAGRAIRLMVELGAIDALIPGFSGLMELTPGDLVHRNTVGEHSVCTLEEVQRLLFSSDDPRFCEIQSRLDGLEILSLAALLHDIGKLDFNGPHSATGAKRALEIAQFLGMDEVSARGVEFLVLNHLRMNEFARLRDLNLKRTVEEFTATVDSSAMLDMLLLLSVGDIRAVGPGLLSQVHLRFLLELHERAMAALRAPDAARADLGRHQRRVYRELSLSSIPREEVERHCNYLPASYLLNTSPDELVAHIAGVEAARRGGPQLDIVDDRTADYTIITLFAKDRPSLLSDITGGLTALGLSVHAAQVYTATPLPISGDGSGDVYLPVAIDCLYVDSDGRQLTETKKRQVESVLLDVLTGRTTVAEVFRRMVRPASHTPMQISVRLLDHASLDYSVIEVRATDTPGLLYQLTHRMSDMGWSIHSARVATWGHEARDVFYVTSSSGHRLSNEEVNAFKSSLGLVGLS